MREQNALMVSLLLAPRGGVKIGHASLIGGLPQDLKYKAGTSSGVRIG